jgi:hypothetical protein
MAHEQRNDIDACISFQAAAAHGLPGQSSSTPESQKKVELNQPWID